MPAQPSDPKEVRFQVRVPVVFDHRNAELVGRLRDCHLRLIQAIGRRSALISNEGFESGRFELWFELARHDPESGHPAVEVDAIAVVEEALVAVGLEPGDGDGALRLVRSEVVTIPLTANPS